MSLLTLLQSRGVTVSPAGTGSGFAAGQPTVSLVVSPAGTASGFTAGSPTVSVPGPTPVVPAESLEGVSGWERWPEGQPLRVYGWLSKPHQVFPAGTDFRPPLPPPHELRPASTESNVRLGQPRISLGVSPLGTMFPKVLRPTSTNTGYAAGSPCVGLVLMPSPTPSVFASGNPTIKLGRRPRDVREEEALILFGDLTLAHG